MVEVTAMRKKKFRLGLSMFQLVNYFGLTMLSLLFIVPFIVVVTTSLVSETELIRRGSFILFPEKFDFAAYKLLLGNGSIIYNAYGITLLRVCIGTFLNLVFTAMMAYALARKQLPYRNVFVTLVFVTMLFEGGIVPSYLLMKGLHLLNSFWALVLPGLISAWNLLIMRHFFAQLPNELEESATIDGASPLTILLRIVLPLSLPMIATIGLFYAVYHWNAWFDATIFINDLNKMPLQVILRRIILSMSSENINKSMIAAMHERPTAQSMKAAAIIVTTLPILFVYPFLQKHFVKGVMIGSIKG
jgi:putative aldouronate transport system permease protein